jgi:hypothetical protein
MVFFSTLEALWGFLGKPLEIVSTPNRIRKWLFVPMAANEPSVKF